MSKIKHLTTSLKADTVSVDINTKTAEIFKNLGSVIHQNAKGVWQKIGIKFNVEFCYDE